MILVASLVLLMQGKGSGTVLLRYTLQQQFHQDVKSLHTDAWLEHTSTAGQRALQVGDDPKWVVLASSGLQRGAANVGAGGMMKKNLPVGSFLKTESEKACMHVMLVSSVLTYMVEDECVTQAGIDMETTMTVWYCQTSNQYAAVSCVQPGTPLVRQVYLPHVIKFIRCLVWTLCRASTSTRPLQSFCLCAWAMKV